MAWSDDALAWLTGCPAKLRAEQPVPLALVDCYLARKDWRGLDTSLQEQKWGDLEFLRFAFLSRSAAELNQKLAADSRWRTAIREAGDRLGPLTALMTMATTWGRDQAREELLWQIAQRFPRERWALRELERLYLAAGNTHGLNKVYSTMASYAPNNFIAQNNLAATSLLLKLNLPKAHALAKEVFTQHPKEAIVASTYAFSLHLQGRTKEGLGVLDKLKPEALETPSVALYYGLLLSANGDTNKAGKYLGIAQKTDLLPEEKALAAEAAKRQVGELRAVAENGMGTSMKIDAVVERVRSQPRFARSLPWVLPLPFRRGEGRSEGSAWASCSSRSCRSPSQVGRTRRMGWFTRASRARGRAGILSSSRATRSTAPRKGCRCWRRFSPCGTGSSARCSSPSTRRTARLTRSRSPTCPAWRRLIPPTCA